MPKRSETLTEIAKPIADDMADRYGTLKNVLSAGIILFSELTPEEREIYMAKAVGRNVASQNTLDSKIRKILDDLGIIPSKKKSRRRQDHPKAG